MRHESGAEEVFMASLTFEPIAVPLREDEQGAIRIGNTRVLLDVVIHEFRNGATAEGIVESYDALTLADVYAVISYYLQHADAVHDYLHRRQQEAKAVREMIEASQPPRPNLRAALLARARASGQSDAPAD
jgi:uncharacterized protein (DUF433 family)